MLSQLKYQKKKISNLFKSVICFLSLVYLPSCSFVPTYSNHVNDKIKLTNNDDMMIYIRPVLNINTKYNVDENITKELNEQFKMHNISITNDRKQATHILELHIRNIVMDLEATFAKNTRNALINNDLNPTFAFDKNNNPNIYFSKLATIKTENNYNILRRRNLAPSVLYTILGASAGFTAGYFLGASISPIGMGFAGAFALGTITYTIYSTFKDEGIIIIYDIIIKENTKRTLTHNHKILVKNSGNASEETTYTTYNNWNTYVSKNAVIAIGSRVIKKIMLKNMCPMIAKTAVEIFK